MVGEKALHFMAAMVRSLSIEGGLKASRKVSLNPQLAKTRFICTGHLATVTPAIVKTG